MLFSIQVLILVSINMASVIADEGPRMVEATSSKVQNFIPEDTQFKDLQFLNSVVEFAGANSHNSQGRGSGISMAVQLGEVGTTSGASVVAVNSQPVEPLEFNSQGGFNEDNGIEEGFSDDEYEYQSEGELMKKKKHSKLKKIFHGDTGVFFEIGNFKGDSNIGGSTPIVAVPNQLRGDSKDALSSEVLANIKESNNPPINAIRLMSDIEAAEIRAFDSLASNSSVQVAATERQQKQRPKFHIGTGLFLDAEMEKDIKQQVQECTGDFCSEVDVEIPDVNEDCEDEKVDTSSNKRKKKGKNFISSESSNSKASVMKKDSKKNKGSHNKAEFKQSIVEDQDEDDENYDEEEAKDGKRHWFWPLSISESRNVDGVHATALIAKADKDTHNLFISEPGKLVNLTFPELKGQPGTNSPKVLADSLSPFLGSFNYTRVISNATAGQVDFRRHAYDYEKSAASNLGASMFGVMLAVGLVANNLL